MEEFKERWFVLDIIKTVAVFFMILAHVGVMYGGSSVLQESTLTEVLVFVAEGIGAPAFIFSMGAAIVLGRQKKVSKIIFRGVLLFLIGYLLNFFKFYPTIELFKTFPDALFRETNRVNNNEGLISFLLIADILQFAGIAYVVCSLLYKFWSTKIRIVSFLLVIPFISLAPILYNKEYASSNYILQMIYGNNYQVYFPIFPWLGFAFLGMGIGDIYKRNFNSFVELIKYILPIGLIFIALGIVLIKIDFDYYFGLDYYHRGLGALIMYCGQLLTTISLYHFIVPFLLKSKKIKTFILFCSSNVTLIYIIQWILIYWCWYFIPYYSQTWPMVWLYFFLFSAITLYATYSIIYLIKKSRKLI